MKRRISIINGHKHYSALLLILLLACLAAPVYAQRRITPVNPASPSLTPEETKKLKKSTETFDRSRLEERLDAEGNIILVDTITGREWVDTTQVAERPHNIYPRFFEVTTGVNIWDPLMRLLGQQYGGLDFWAELSLHNRVKPIVEMGMSSADITPDGLNYTFKSKAAPYFKLGVNYNVFYNSNPDYQFCVGLRYGLSSFKYHVTDVTLNDGYWDTDQKLEFPEASSTAGYLEVVFSIKVKIAGPISMGWALKYHSITNESKNAIGQPMYIPGFGKRANAITGGLSIMYTLPLNRKAPPEV